MTIKFSIAVVILSSVVFNTSAQAHDERSDQTEPASYPAAVSVADLPAGHQPLVVGGVAYYFTRESFIAPESPASTSSRRRPVQGSECYLTVKPPSSSAEAPIATTTEPTTDTSKLPAPTW